MASMHFEMKLARWGGSSGPAGAASACQLARLLQSRLPCRCLLGRLKAAQPLHASSIHGRPNSSDKHPQMLLCVTIAGIAVGVWGRNLHLPDMHRSRRRNHFSAPNKPASADSLVACWKAASGADCISVSRLSGAFTWQPPSGHAFGDPFAVIRRPSKTHKNISGQLLVCPALAYSIAAAFNVLSQPEESLCFPCHRFPLCMNFRREL